MSFLKAVIEKKRQRLEGEIRQDPWIRLEETIRELPPAQDFREALLRRTPGIIAEFKRSSPSKGVIRHDRDPVRQVEEYAKGGADAMSVLTEEDYFHGSPEDLQRVAATGLLPVLRKDFIFHPYQVLQARAWGADAILFIWRVLGRQGYQDLLSLALEHGLTPLVEIGDERELEEALAFNPPLLGINNRNLDTLEVKPDTTPRLLERIPNDVVVVGESGMKSYADVQRLVDLGVKAVLIGEALMRADDPASAIRGLREETPCFG